MNPIKYMFFATLLFSSYSQAEEKSTETLINAIEIDHFIVNWSPNSETLGRIITYRCSGCTPVTMTFNSATELLIDEQIHPISDLAKKIDWAGVISVTNHEPTKIIRIRIY